MPFLKNVIPSPKEPQWCKKMLPKRQNPSTVLKAGKDSTSLMCTFPIPPLPTPRPPFCSLPYVEVTRLV